ncbi:MAG: class I SAM-dependent DNA methyltransferase [Candidatus Aminicenantes bacterium]|jgi:type I restriction enzyme M protein
MLNQAIKSKIDQLWDKFWSGGISNPLTAIEQISYLLFMRRLDELDLKQKADAEFTEEEYKSLFEGTFELPDSKEKVDKDTLRWSHFKHMESEEMLLHIQTKVFPFVRNLKEEGTSFARHMRDAVFIIPKPSLLAEAVSIIDDIYKEIEKESEKGESFHDTQGDMYEYLLSEISTAGKNGQFRTPRHIIKLMVELVAPRLEESICDPACGTGGFLLGAYHYILTQYTSNEHLKTDSDGFTRGTLGNKLSNQKLWKHLRERTFYGYDFDTTMVRIGLMNLILHGISNPQIDYKDTLSKKYNEDNRYDVMFANPPFTGFLDKLDINESFSIKTKKTELLFVNRIINSLVVGGRAGVIVPSGVLFGYSKAHKDLRKMLIEKCELQGVISMPPGVFKPYAGVSAAILIFVKGGKTKNVWFYDMKLDGYSLDDKRSKQEGYGDLQDIVHQWKNRDKQEDNNRQLKHFFVPVEEIVDNGYDLSINFYIDDEYSEVKYEKPSIILKNLETVEDEIISRINGLKELLS